MAFVAFDDLPASRLIRRHQLAQILRVELLRKRRRPHQIAEHHGQLAAIGLLRSIWRRMQRHVGWNRVGLAAGGARGLENPTPRAQRQLEILKVGFGQLRDIIDGDLLGFKPLGEITEVELLQPIANFGHAFSLARIVHAADLHESPDSVV